MEDPEDENVVYIAGGGINGGNHLIKLRKIGNSIVPEEMSYPFNNTVTAMAYSPIDPSHWYVMTYNGSFYHSTDYGISWQISTGFSGPESHYFYGSTIYPSNQTLGKVIIGEEVGIWFCVACVFRVFPALREGQHSSSIFCCCVHCVGINS